MKRLFQLLLPGRRAAGWALAAALLAVFAAVAGIALLAVSGWLITGAALAGVALIAGVELFAPGAVIRGAAIGRTVGRYLERLVGHEATFRQLAELRVRTFQRLLSLPIARLESMARGDTMNRLTRDIDLLDHFIPSLLLPSAAAFLATAGAALALAAVDGALGGILALLLAAGTAALAVGVVCARAPGERLARATPSMRASLARWLDALPELISVGRGAEFAREIMRRVDEQLDAQLSQRRVEAGMQAALAAAGYAAFWGVFTLACLLFADGRVSAPFAAAAALVALGLVDAWQSLAPSWSFFETCRQAGRRVGELTEHQGGPERGRVDSVADRSLRAQAVSFRYPNAMTAVLQGIDLEAGSGQRILIRGPSGVGKTTLGKLLAGILEPTAGNVGLGGVALQDLTNDALRRHIGYLSQDAVLFEDTLRSNLFPGSERADEVRTREVLEALCLNDLLGNLPHGLDSWLGAHGTAVSGGEARRIALARLLLADFPVVVLDEPTAGIDRRTGGLIAESLDRLLAGKTTVVLSHEPGVLPSFDREYRLTRHGLVPAR
jgi:ATP-binding cassette subfamily C protein CydC